MIDRKALAIDQAQSHAAWDVTAALMRTVSNYQSVLKDVRLEPIPIFGTTIDAFAQLPLLKQAILTAREHANTWQRVGMDLYLAVFMGVAIFRQLLQQRAGEISAIVGTAMDAKRALTDTEKANIIAALRTLENQLNTDKSKIESVKPSLVSFIVLITGDYASLVGGGQKIDTAIAAVEEATTREATKYLDQPGIMRMIIELGTKMSNELRAVSPAVHRLEGANDAAQIATRDLIALWTTVAVKYGSVIKELINAKTTKDFEDLPILLEIAVASYEELVAYMQGTARLF